jgi:inner membrane protein
VPVLALVFAVLSLVAWVALRRMVGVKEGQVKMWDKDING